MSLKSFRTAAWIAMSFGGVLMAHHTFSMEFDTNKPLTLKGTVQTVDWTEPHVTFTMNVTLGAPTGKWKLEGANPSTLTRQTWTQSMLKVGDAVTVRAYQARDNAMFASARSITIADGRTLSISDAAEDGGPPAVLTSSAASGSSELPQIASGAPALAAVGFVTVLVALSLRLVR